MLQSSTRGGGGAYTYGHNGEVLPSNPIFQGPNLLGQSCFSHFHWMGTLKALAFVYRHFWPCFLQFPALLFMHKYPLGRTCEISLSWNPTIFLQLVHASPAPPPPPHSSQEIQHQLSKWKAYCVRGQ